MLLFQEHAIIYHWWEELLHISSWVVHDIMFLSSYIRPEASPTKHHLLQITSWRIQARLTRFWDAFISLNSSLDGSCTMMDVWRPGPGLGLVTDVTRLGASYRLPLDFTCRNSPQTDLGNWRFALPALQWLLQYIIAFTAVVWSCHIHDKTLLVMLKSMPMCQSPSSKKCNCTSRSLEFDNHSWH